jgi:2,4-dienoyl-CoA reductase-like NADH-dependent reductase (Old Yellow Enzyme family)/thioredoxin reductase
MDRVTSAWTLGPLELRNRLVMAPVKTAYGTAEGAVTERHLHFYRSVAAGGAGLIVLEPVAVTANGREHPKQLAIHRPESAAGLATITAVIHESGGKACLNLNHAGRAANPAATGVAPVAPSPVACPARGTEARALTVGEIAEIVAAFAEAARRAEAAGFDALEVQAGHGYLLQQFMLPETNRRDDGHGREPLRFASEVLGAVRAACHLPLLVRVTRPLAADAATEERLQALCGLAEEAGAVALHVGMGDSCTAPAWYYHHGSLPEAPQEAALRFFRAASRLPLIAAGRMGDPERVRRLLDQGLLDAVALGRPLVADPSLPAKWRRRAYDNVLECGYCLQGCLARVARGEGLSCIVNPTVGQPPAAPAARKRRVLVAGAGPAGLAAALAAWRSGDGVIVAEARGEPGGTFRAAPLSPGKSTMKRPMQSLLRLVERERIPIMCSQPVDGSFLARIHPDLLVWAAGSVQHVPPIPGLEHTARLTSLEFYLEGKRLPGKSVLILGGGMVGVEAAETLAEEGYEPTIVEILPELARDMEKVSRTLTLKRLGEKPSVTTLLGTTVARFEGESVVIATESGERRLPAFAWVLIATGLKSRPVPAGFTALVPQIRIVGDAREPRDIEAATREGYEAGTGD